MAINVLHVNASDISGGAARAAYRIHRAVLDHGDRDGIRSRMRVIQQFGDDPTVIAGAPRGQSRVWRFLRPRVVAAARRGFHSTNPCFHSVAWLATGLGNELERFHKQGANDIAHFHWLGDGTISIEEIGRLSMPLVWTLHDQWPFCGAEHYTHPPAADETASSDERFVIGYTPESRRPGDSGQDLNRRTWMRKRKAWRRPIRIVCSSTWLADCAKRSALMARWPVTVVPHPLDLDVWNVLEQAEARNILRLPPENPLVVFGALGGASDSRKGADLLLEALRFLRSQVEGTPLANLSLAVFGQGQPSQRPVVGFPIHYAGRLQDDVSLRLLYAAADVMVVPSRQEAFGQTASEAHACGTPVVAFRTGGLVDIVEDRVTGALAEPFDPRALAAAIRWVLEDPARRRRMGAAARERAERLWAPCRIAAQYAEIYRESLVS